MKSFINAVYIQAYLKDAQNRLSRKRFLTHTLYLLWTNSSRKVWKQKLSF